MCLCILSPLVKSGKLMYKESSQGVAAGATQNILGYILFWEINNIYRTTSFSLYFPTKGMVLVFIAGSGVVVEGLSAHCTPDNPLALWRSQIICLHHQAHTISFNRYTSFLTLSELLLILE